MKLQLALDDISLSNALVLVQKIRDNVDIIEIGTPLIIEAGMQAVREFRHHFPEKEILADTKIMDAGDYEAELTYRAGADFCTVLAVTDILTVKACLDAARKHEKKIFVDMICVNDIEKRVQELETIGVDCISVHVGVDQQAAGQTPLELLQRVKRASKHSQVSVAGGINENNIQQYVNGGADIIIVGGGINHAKDPVKAAETIYHKIQD